MELTKIEAEWSANYIINYYKNMHSIKDYQTVVKLARMEELPQPLFGMGGLEDDLFIDYDMHPKDMKFKIIDCSKDSYYDLGHTSELLEITTSAPVEASNGPVRRLCWIVLEENTNKVIGFVRVCSPYMNCKPRHDWLGGVPKDSDAFKRFNQHVNMGTVIVPVQPFGFNYIGGKLLALLCMAHETREAFNKKYGTDIVLFETTSLYGSSKSSSQYDGMKPFLRYKGLTDSNFAPLLHDQHFRDLEKWFMDRNGGVRMSTAPTSRKMRAQGRMIAITRKFLGKGHPLLGELDKQLKKMRDIQEQKRYYISTLGFSNSREVILGLEEPKIDTQNHHKFHWDFMLDWWVKKAGNRFETLRKDGRLRGELETWNSGKDMQIIR